MTRVMTSSTLAKTPKEADLIQHAGITDWQAISLVARREVSVRLRDKAFLLSGLFMLGLVIAAVVLPALNQPGPTTVATVGSTARAAASAAGATVTEVPNLAAAEAAVLDGSVDAAVVPDDSGLSPLGVAIIAVSEAPTELVVGLSTASPVRLLEPDATDPAVGFFIPFAFGMVFFTTSLTFGLAISQSVVEEKQTRIVEILVAAIPVRALLAGKVIGNTVLALGQIVLIVAVALVALTATGSNFLDSVALSAVGAAAAWFVPFFLVGFVLLAGLWAVAGALVSRLEDLGSTTMPMQLLVMLPFFGVLFGNQNPVFLTWLSYVPFSAPTAMPVRIFQDDVAGLWEPLLALGVMAATAAASVLLAARLYEGSLLRTNGKSSLRQAWSHRV